MRCFPKPHFAIELVARVHERTGCAILRHASETFHQQRTTKPHPLILSVRAYWLELSVLVLLVDPDRAEGGVIAIGLVLLVATYVA